MDQNTALATINDRPAKRPPLKNAYPSKKLDVGKALTLRYVKGLSYEQISKVCGVSKQAICDRLKHLPTPESVKEYESNRTTVMGAVEYSLVSQLTDSTKLRKASLNNVAFAFTQLHKAGRLEEGLSTSNIAYADMVKARDQLVQERAKLEECK